MTVYLIMAALIFSLIFIDGVKLKRRYYFILFLLCFLGLFRGQSVGLDVLKYCINIRHTTFNPNSWNYYTVFEDGYNALIASYNYLIGGTPLFFIGLCNLLFIFAWNIYAKSKTNDYYVALFVLFFSGFYNQSFNIIRQYFALSIMLLVLSKVHLEGLNKVGVVMIIIVTIFVGTFFHNSIYILLFIPLYYFINHLKINIKILCYVLLLSSFVIFYLDVIKNILSSYGYFYLVNEKTNGYFQTSLEDFSESNDYSLYRIVFDNLFCLYVIYKSRHANIYLYLYILGQTFVNLFAPLNTLFARMSGVLLIPAIPAIVSIWSDAGSNRNRLVVTLYLFVLFSNLMIKNYGQTIPYVFFFE